MRIRRWPSEGLEAEYADVLLASDPGEVWAEQLNFDTRQPFARLPADPKSAMRGIDP